MTNEQIGIVIADARHSLGLSQAELARRLNVSRVCVANWENGYHGPSLESAVALAAELGIARELGVAEPPR